MLSSTQKADNNNSIFLGNIYAIDSHAGFGGDVFEPGGIARALMARDHKDPILIYEVWKMKALKEKL